MLLNQITDKAEYEQTLAALLELMESNPHADSAEGIELERLAVLIERYEVENFPIDLPSPEDARRFREEQMVS